LTIQLAPRGKYQGATQILRFNWPFYFAALLFLLATGFAIAVVSIPNSVRVPLSAAILLAAFWLTGSLAIAHYIYDRSPIYHGTWIEQTLRHSPAGWANFHSVDSMNLAERFKHFFRGAIRQFSIFSMRTK